MDGDIFGAVSRLGRDAAEGVISALRGAQFDPFLAARCLDVVFGAANGVSSLPAVIRVFQSLRDAPLFAPTMIESSLDAVTSAIHNAKDRTVLDLILRSTAERRLLAGNFDPRAMVNSFCLEILDRAVITPRGGLVELEGGGPERRDEARAILARVATEAGARLESRPDAKRLGLSRDYARLDANSDLCGGGDENS